MPANFEVSSNRRGTPGSQDESYSCLKRGLELRGMLGAGSTPTPGPTPEIQPGEAGRGEIVELSGSAGHQRGPMSDGCLMASQARLPFASSFVALHRRLWKQSSLKRCSRFRYPSRRSFA